MISSHFPILPSLPTGPLTPGATAAGARDLPSLAVFLDLMTPTLDATVPPLGERQVLAASGTALPNDTDAGDDDVDPAFAWLTPDTSFVAPSVLANATPRLSAIAAPAGAALANTGRLSSSTSISDVGLVMAPSTRGAMPGDETPGRTTATSNATAVMPKPSVPTEAGSKLIPAVAAPTVSPVATENAGVAKAPMRSAWVADVRLPATSLPGIKHAALAATEPTPTPSLTGTTDQSRPASTVAGLTANVAPAPAVITTAPADKPAPPFVLAGASPHALASAPLREPGSRFAAPASMLATASQPQTATAITDVPLAPAGTIAVPQTRTRAQYGAALSPALVHGLPAQAPPTAPLPSTAATMFPPAVAAASTQKQERFGALPLLHPTASPLNAPVAGAATAALVSVPTTIIADTNASTQAREQLDLPAPSPALHPTASPLKTSIAGEATVAAVQTTISADPADPAQTREQPALAAPLRPRLATAAPLQPVAPFSRVVPVASVPTVNFAEGLAAAKLGERDGLSDPLSPAPVAATQPQVTLAATTPDQPALDMARQDWPQAMIGRIEALRDAADAVDTSIRLLPDALGAIDVSVRQEGETVHLRFSAEQAQTRQLLADAQPRLQELAEARGLRLGGSGVDTGANHGGTGQQPHRAPPFSDTPVSAAHVPAGARATAASDLNQRIA